MRWIRALGYIIAVVGAVLASAKTILDWLGRLDFIMSHRAELGWIGRAMEYLIAPPWWLPWFMLASGLVIIWADTRYRIGAVAKPKADVNLTFESNLGHLPDTGPEEGQVLSMRLSFFPDQGSTPIGFIRQGCQPGRHVDWFRDLKFPQVYRCEITNYGSDPLIQIGLKFKIEYKEISWDDTNPSVSTVRNGIHSEAWPVLISKLDPGKNNAMVFYVYNESAYHAVVTPPDVVSYIALGEKAQRQAALLPIGMVATMSLWPVERVSGAKRSKSLPC
jgi:hypothetical protein